MIPTVIKAAATTMLTSVENVRTDLGLAQAAFPNDRVTRMIKTASSRVATYCNRTFGRQIYREAIHSVPREGLLLGAGPVNRIVSVGIVGGAVFDADEYLLTDGKLLIEDGRSGIGDGTAYNLWRALRPSLVVIYEAGWLLPGEPVGDDFTGDTDLPADIEDAVMKLISMAVSEGGRDIGVRQETNEGVGSTSYYIQGADASLSHPGAESALQPYRNLALV